MTNYLKIFRDMDEYAENCERPVYSHIVENIVMFFDNNYNPCQDDGCPPDGCCDLDGGYYA